MRKALFTMMCLAAMLAAGTGLKAQEITITLEPGWNWISYTNSAPMQVGDALGGFVPMEGDIIQAQRSNTQYRGGHWRGGLTQFVPGRGYKYYSSRTENVELVFAQAPSTSVVTAMPTDITATSAVVGGTVTLPEGTHVFLRGVCWGTAPSPDIDGDHTTEGTGIGSFSGTLEGLNPNTTYFVRAYAVSDHGLSYGNELSFTTLSGIPVVTTAEVSDVTGNSALCGGTVTDGGGLEITARGVCWSTSPNPTLNDSHTTDGTGTGSFTSSLTGLNASTTYYVRAYASNSLVTIYGGEQSFTTEAGGGSGGDAPTGAIDGKFTINADGDQVYFSQGNLQYIGSASTPYWKFADNQWDILGYTTGQHGSSSQNVDRDLFGWGTSGYNHGANCYQPWSISSNYSDYYAYGAYTNDLNDGNGQADWGYNPISNGGNQANQWRTLTQPEWAYVFNTRTTNSGIRYAKAKVNDRNGVILLPDDWSSDTYSLSNSNTYDARYSSNTISASQWNTLEQAGAVFLPAAGDRGGTSVTDVGSIGNYWSASYYDSPCARYVYFIDTYLNTDDIINRCVGHSVRLVAPAEN